MVGELIGRKTQKKKAQKRRSIDIGEGSPWPGTPGASAVFQRKRSGQKEELVNCLEFFGSQKKITQKTDGKLERRWGRKKGDKRE